MRTEDGFFKHIRVLVNATANEGSARMVSAVAKSVPLGRLGGADEIAKAVSFLASDEGSYAAGTELYVDGGVAQI
jgi:NAD(P)-dependent dehydrogenase (short-subunit alcohol dehydrogenase family)